MIEFPQASYVTITPATLRLEAVPMKPVALWHPWAVAMIVTLVLTGGHILYPWAVPGQLNDLLTWLLPTASGYFLSEFLRRRHG